MRYHECVFEGHRTFYPDKYQTFFWNQDYSFIKHGKKTDSISGNLYRQNFLHFIFEVWHEIKLAAQKFDSGRPHLIRLIVALAAFFSLVVVKHNQRCIHVNLIKRCQACREDKIPEGVEGREGIGIASYNKFLSLKMWCSGADEPHLRAGHDPCCARKFEDEPSPIPWGDTCPVETLSLTSVRSIKMLLAMLKRLECSIFGVDNNVAGVEIINRCTTTLRDPQYHNH